MPSTHSPRLAKAPQTLPPSWAFWNTMGLAPLQELRAGPASVPGGIRDQFCASASWGQRSRPMQGWSVSLIFNLMNSS